MKVSAVVVSHRSAADVEVSLPALAPQVDELLVVSDVPGSVGRVPEGTRVLENARSRSFAANANQGVAQTSGELMLLANPDTVAEPVVVVATPPLSGTLSARGPVSAASAMMPRPSRSHCTAAPVTKIAPSSA